MYSGLTLSNKKILVIDDQRPFQLMLKGMLSSLGAKNIVLVSSGESASKACTEFEFDIFFIDYNLGAHKKNGRQLLEEIKSQYQCKADSLFFMVTGESHRPMVLGAIENQPDDYLMKPFSQNVLKHRLEKADKKKQSHKLVFKAMKCKQKKEAITECLRLLKYPNRYHSYTTLLLSQLYIAEKDYKKAETLLLEKLKQARQTWCLMQLATIKYHQRQYDDAINYAEEVLGSAPLMVEALDILAKSESKLMLLEQALETAKKATELSPYSIQRQEMLCFIAQKNEEYKVVHRCCQSILDMTQGSNLQKPIYLFNAIRSTLEIAEHSRNKKEINKYQQEVSLALQRNSFDHDSKLSLIYKTFESICQARIDVISGLFLRAKKAFYQILKKHNFDITRLPEDLLPDAYILLVRIGEFEEADALYNTLGQFQFSAFIKTTIEQVHKFSQEKQEAHTTMCQQAQTLFKKGQYQQASDIFSQTFNLAPMHTGSAINLIKSTIKLIEGSDNENRHSPHADVTRKANRVLDNVALPLHYQKEYDQLRSRLVEYIDL